MKGDPIPDADHVVRYVKPTAIDDGNIDGSAFCLRSDRLDEIGLSVNWLEWFSGKTLNEQLNEVRQLFRLKRSKNGFFVQLNVGQTRQAMAGELPELLFVEDPLPAQPPFKADPSHALVIGLPVGDSEFAELIGDMIADCVMGMHPAIPT
jgi:hypothetical protein